MKGRIVDRTDERRAGRIHVYKGESMWWVRWWTGSGPEFHITDSLDEALRFAVGLAAERTVEGCAE